MVGVPKRPEIKVAEFARALDTEPLADIPFDPAVFGTAANNGQMIAETNAACKAAEMFLSIAQVVTGKAEMRRPKRNILEPFISKLQRKKA
jgi:pilus assembly protein CpaE